MKIREIIKQSSRKFLISTGVLIVIGLITTACGSTVVINQKSNSETSQNTATVANNESPKNKPAENTASPEPAQAQLVEVADGRNSEIKEIKPTRAEEQLVDKEFKSKEAAIKSKFGEAYCSEEESNLIVTGLAEGAFTKPGSSQKAYLYELCQSGSSHFGVGGLMIFENEKVVAHYSYGENGLDNEIFSLPDVNKNGLSELVFVSGSTHQGYTSSGLSITEFKDGNFTLLGDTTTYDSNDGAVEDDKKVETTAYKISVQPSANPSFFRETYQKKGHAKTWSLVKKSEKMSLEKGDFGKNYKIS